MLRYFETIAPSTAASISASSKTMNGALPPSSRPSFFTPTAACSYRILPTSVEPVKPTNRTAGCAHSTLPIADELPVSTLNTPFGIPARSASAASASAVSGVSLAGFSTTVQPAASAGDDLARDHRAGKIPRRDRAADADRLANRQDARIVALRGNGLAIHPARFFRVELDIGRADIDLAARFRQRLALLRGEDQRDIVAILRRSGRTSGAGCWNVPSPSASPRRGMRARRPRPRRWSRRSTGAAPSQARSR